jgi:hypothetical protein
MNITVPLGLSAMPDEWSTWPTRSSVQSLESR